jgi:hypothetical protein
MGTGACSGCQFGVRCKFYDNFKPPIIDPNGRTVQCRRLPVYEYRDLNDWCGEYVAKSDWE